MRGFNKKYKLWLLIIFFVFFILPLFIECIIINGVFGWKPFTTSFQPNDWFAFWGSYLGGGFTLVAIWVSIEINKENVTRELEKERNALENSLEKHRKSIEEATRKEINLIKKLNIERKITKQTTDVNNLYKMLSFDVPITLLDFIKEKESLYIKMLKAFEEIAYFYRSYYNESDVFADIVSFSQSIAQDMFKALENLKNSNKETKEESIDTSSLYDEVSNMVVNYRSELRCKADKLITDLENEKDDLIVELYKEEDSTNA